MSLQAVIASSFVGIGVLVALYAERRVALPSLAELRANIWAADSHLASLEAKKDGLLNRLRAWLDKAGLQRLHVLEFLGLTAAAALTSFLVTLVVFGGYVLSLELALAGAVAPALYVLAARRGREEAIEEQLDRALSILINSMQGTGRNLRSALVDLVVEDLDGGVSRMRAVLPAPLGPELAWLVRGLSATSDTLEEALSDTARSLSHPAFDMFVSAVHSSQGGQVVGLLKQVRSHLHERKALRGSVRASFSLVVSQVYILALMPLGLLAMWRVLSPEASHIVFGTTLGQIAVVFILAYSWMGVILVSRESRPENLIKGVRM